MSTYPTMLSNKSLTKDQYKAMGSIVPGVSLFNVNFRFSGIEKATFLDMIHVVSLFHFSHSLYYLIAALNTIDFQ